MENKELVESIDKVGPRTTKNEITALLKEAKKKLLEKQSNKVTAKKQEFRLPDNKDLETWASDTRNNFAEDISKIVNEYRELNNTLVDLKNSVMEKEKELQEKYEIEKQYIELASILEAKNDAIKEQKEVMDELEAKYVLESKTLMETHARKVKELENTYKDKEAQAKFTHQQLERNFQDLFDEDKRNLVKELNVYISSKEDEIKTRLKELHEREQFVNKNKDLLDSFDERLEKEVNKQVNELSDKMAEKTKREIEKLENDLLTQEKIYENRLESLTRELEKANNDNAELKELVKEAQSRVQDIASTAVKNAKSEVHTVGFTDKKS